MMAPVYAGNYANATGKSSGSDAKNKGELYEGQTKDLLRLLGMEPEDEEDRLKILGVHAYSGMPLGMGGPAPSSTPMYGNTMGRPGYTPRPSMLGQGMPLKGPQGYDTAMININYTAPDGTMYSMNVATPNENKGQALYNVLNGLYGLMMAEGKTGQSGKAGKTYANPGSYAGKGSSYAGGKGGSGGGK